MKRINFFVIFVIIACTLFSFSVSSASTDYEHYNLTQYMEGQLIVSIDNNYDFSIQSTSDKLSDHISIMEQSGFKVIDSHIDPVNNSISIQRYNDFSIQSYGNDFNQDVIENMGYVSLVEYPDNFDSMEKAMSHLKRILTDSGNSVKYIEPNYIVQTFDDFTITMHTNQRWHYNMINAPAAWNITTGSSAVRIAVLDTGIDHNHQNLRDIVNRELGVSYVGNDTMDNRGHGTHVAGTIASYGSVSGVMNNATLIPIKVLDDNGRGTSFAVQQGILQASRLNADVINMSFGGFNFSRSMNDACRTAVSRGSVLVAATGNDGASPIAYPAAFDSVIAVGSVNSRRERSNFSNYGDGIHLMAPGANIYSTIPSNRYASYSGTSMAAPHVSGVIGLMRSVNRDISVEDIISILTNTAQNAGSSNYYGHGIVDAHAAVLAANSSSSDIPTTHTSITTDKLLYNRGQSVTSTALITDQHGRPLHQATVNFTFSRPNGSSFNQNILTNQAGIAQLVTNSSSSTALGTYTIKAETTFAGYVSSSDTTTIQFVEESKIAHYKFDENDGIIAYDSTGKSGTSTLHNGASFVSGLIGNAVKLNGTNEYIELPQGILEEVTNFTIALWVKLDSLNTWQRIFDFGNNTNVNMFLTSNSSTGSLRFGIKNGGSEQQINSSESIPIGRWVHIAVVLSDGIGTIYVDGKETARNNNITITPYHLGPTLNNYIGRSQYPDPYLNGTIDDFKIFNYPLDSDEINSLSSININPPSFIIGDINNDGNIDSLDLILLRRYILSIIDDFPNAEARYAADINGDGFINSTDYTLLRRYVLEIISEFPVSN
ncbi:UNVERIFIED_CONTAM: Subtilisin-like serine proteases [Acetivibrio alkalicellulosi]